jgi:hypothetical protein
MANPPVITMRVLDGGLEPGLFLKLPEMTPNDFVVPRTFSIEQVLVAIYDRLRGKRVSRLTMICQGIGVMVYGDQETTQDDKGRNVTVGTLVLPGAARSLRSMAVCKIYGGYGLFLGNGQLTLANASLFNQLRGWFTADGVLEICGCAAADTGPTLTTRDRGELSGDGPALMSALAAATGAAVRAPIRLQNVNTNWYLGTADRTAFVGPTYLFKPNGQRVLESACY